MYLIGFLRSSIPMLVCIIGICLFTVRREHCQKKFFGCILVSFVMEYAIYYFMFTEEPGIPGILISKILTTLMITFLIFWGGMYVYGGWSRIGIYIFGTDMFLAMVERAYWTVWEHFTRRTVEVSTIYYKGNSVVEKNSFPVFLIECLFLIPFLVGGYKLRNRPLRPEWLVKAVVINYLVLGASPLITRPGFEGEQGKTAYLVEIVWVILGFLVIMSIHVTAARENQRILYIRKQVVAEQSRLLMMQKEKVRRLHHDVKKHISNLKYILEKEPDLRADPSLLRYQEKLSEAEGWMKGVFFCEYPVMNLCFDQMKRYCDEKGIAFDIALKRLSFSGWQQEDQLMFGTLLLNLLQMFGDTGSVRAVRCSGDCLLGQNLLRFTIASGADNSLSQNKVKERLKDKRLISDMEKDIRLILSKYEGEMEHTGEENGQTYVINWKDENGTRSTEH